MRKSKRNLAVVDKSVHDLCKKVYGIDDVMKGLNMGLRRKRNYNRPRVVKVVNMYFHLKMSLVLQGNKVEFANGMTIQIVKEPSLRPIKWINAKYCGKEGQEYVYNPNRTGYQYKFLIEWDKLKEHQMTFRVAPMYRKMLHKILVETDQEYPTYEHTETSIN